MMRPRPARWFEVLVARDDCALLLEALAATGRVELESRVPSALPSSLAELQPWLARGAELALRYSAYWPSDGLAPGAVPAPPAITLTRAIEQLQQWGAQAEPLIVASQQAQAEREELERWSKVLAALGDSPLDLAAFGAAGPLARVLLIEYPPELAPESTQAIVRQVPTAHASFAFAMGTASELDSLAREATAMKGRVHPIPAWLTPTAALNRDTIARRRAELAHEAKIRAAEFEAINQRLGIRAALGDLYRLQWLMRNVHGLESGEHFNWVTGWTSDFDGRLLQQAIDRCQARALLHFPRAPRGLRAPLLLANPAWARPFEIFPRALGMPATDEADPSVLLALVVPLIFGFMFGDLGHGLTIAALAFVYRKRFSIAPLLIAGGLSSAVFGLLFGSVFCREDWIAALWMHPLSHPLELLTVPVLGGAVLLAAGLLLGALASYWRGEWARFMGEDMGLMAVYGGLLGSFFNLSWIGLAAVGTVAFVIGHVLHAGRAAAAGAAVGELIEKTLQLLINTLSFARVGAFALAHAGLSSAIVALADSTPNVFAWWLVMLIGNLAVIVIEAMVVSIQTTRLVLFEFFTRFLHGGGRVFHPLPAPPSFSFPDPD